MKLTTSEVCTILLCNGHICARHSPNFKRPYYGVYQTTYRRVHQVGHITPKQFQEMVEADLIKLTSSRTNKYGHVLNYYEIPLREESEDEE